MTANLFTDWTALKPGDQITVHPRECNPLHQITLRAVVRADGIYLAGSDQTMPDYDFTDVDIFCKGYIMHDRNAQEMTQRTHVAYLADNLLSAIDRSPPDFVIGDPDNPYLLRWYLRRNRPTGCIYLHNILRDDDDRALHDHPWNSTSIVLSGKLREVLPDGERILTPGSITSRLATDAHRLEIVDGPVWTLFITGPMVRDWGFHCPQGWVPWQEFLDQDNPGLPGRGCGEQS